MRKMTVVTIALTLVVCAVAVAQEDKPWEQPGTDVGQEIVGPDGGVMVWVPAGNFPMGSTEEHVAILLKLSSREWPEVREFLFNAETPQRQVEMDGFWIQKHEVTNARYRAFCEATGREFPKDSDQGDDHPAVSMNWHEAVAYAEHYGLGLPTEAQWEYAARGPDGLMYPWGNGSDRQKLCCKDNQGPDGKTFPVGSFAAGASWCGALDMAGNVCEWCADWYDPNYYKTAPSSNPTGPGEGVIFVVPTIGRVPPRRVVRGSAWNYGSVLRFRCADRDSYSPDYRDVSLGFRCARTVL